MRDATPWTAIKQTKCHPGNKSRLFLMRVRGSPLRGDLCRAVPGAYGISTPPRLICIGMKRLSSARSHSRYCCLGAWPLMERTAIAFRPRFRCEVRRVKLGQHQGRGRARFRMLLFAWIRF
jgi:hypothetical protein